MATTFIKTGNLPRTRVPGAGEATDVLNEAICGAKNVRATLRWLHAGDRLDATPKASTHQLIYLMDGHGVITLNTRTIRWARARACTSARASRPASRPEGADGVELLASWCPKWPTRA